MVEHVGKALASIIITILLSVLVSAESFEAEIKTIDGKITVDEAAIFNITVKNTYESEQEFRITGANPDIYDWIIRTEPPINPITFRLEPNKEKTVTLHIKPIKKKTGEIGSKFVNLRIESETTDEVITRAAKIGLVAADAETTGYVPTVVMRTDLADQINPSEELGFGITLSNQNKLEMDEVRLVVSSKFISEELTFPLSAEEEKTIRITKQLDPQTPPQTDTLEVSLFYQGENILRSGTKNYEILSHTSLIEEVTEKKGFLSFSQQYDFTNKGNGAYEDQARIKISPLKRLFSTTSPEPDQTEGSYFIWDLSLDPSESRSITISQNYIGLALIIIIIITVLVAIQLNKSPLILKKEVTDTETDEGGISKVKVLITITNRAANTLSDISIYDKVPKLLHVEKHTTIGSLKPKKITKNSKHDTLIVWEIEELMPGEERVITYYLKSNLKILGGLTLQAAQARFHQGEKERKPLSNKVHVKV